jgi:hypothetical protein
LILPPWGEPKQRDPSKARAKRLKGKRQDADEQLFGQHNPREAFNVAARALQAEASAAARNDELAGHRTYAYLMASLFDTAESLVKGWRPTDADLKMVGLRVQRPTEA